MQTPGPEERERFAQPESQITPLSGARRIPEEEKAAPKVVLGGSLAEVLCGAATIVLAILGLTGIMPGELTSIATIVFGAALIAQGGAIASRFGALSRAAPPVEWDTRAELGSGMGAELVCGAAGVVLGVLALLGLAPMTLTSIAVIVFGGALLLGGGATADLGALDTHGAHQHLAHVARQASMAAAGLQSLVGAGAVVLGILALVGIYPMVLTFVALLALGSIVVVSGSAVSGRAAAALRR
ncbi:hypothetical protein WMF26_24555 [Sorangium sp. So ce185]|uniref:hypothetical protein n=1 Tax=Sorangium sp. So ce185 TaxID=3133287 RepID=UPI003F62DB69